MFASLSFSIPFLVANIFLLVMVLWDAFVN